MNYSSGSSGPFVILAGGAGTRMGPSGRVQPKAAMVAYSEPLIVRLVRHATAFGFTPVVSSTEQGCDALHDVLSAWQLGDVPMLVNAAHSRGPLEAMHEALQRTHVTALVGMADMFFLSNPFSAFAESNDARDSAGISPTPHEGDLLATAAACMDGDIIIDIDESKTMTSGPRWNGLCRFSSDIARDLDGFLQSVGQGRPVGDFLRYRIGQQHGIRAIPCPDVINVNEPMQLLVASLYVAAEQADVGADALLESAERLRRNPPRVHRK